MNDQERLAAFQRSMSSLVEADITRLKAEMEQMRRVQELQQEEITERSEDGLLQSAQLEAERTVRSAAARATAEGQKRLLLVREKLTQELFANVRAELEAFTKTEKYVQFLKDSTGQLRQALSQADAVLYLREQDMCHVSMLRESWGGEIKEDPAITLGGVRASSREGALFLDETLDARLHDQQAWFRTYAVRELMIGGAV